MRTKKYLTILIILGLVVFAISKGREKFAKTGNVKNVKLFLKVKDVLSANFSKPGIDWDENIFIDGEKLKLNYTFDQDLEQYIMKTLKRYFSAHTSVVVINNDTGAILSAIDYERKNRKFSRSLSFSSTNPAASLFKIITAAKLLEKGDLSPKSNMEYRGKSTTLYKYQLKKPKRYKRNITFQKAFAYSNNVIFGKAAIENLTATGIFNMAERFGFNQELLHEVSSGVSRFPLPENQYNLAELASGFNKETLISPVHAATLGSIIANDGVMRRPHILKEITKYTDNKTRSLWKYTEPEVTVLKTRTVSKLQDMMELTVRRGTARRLFYTMRRSLRKQLVMGAKTGTITGGLPYGKRDWIVVYAKPKDDKLPSISIAVMIVNVNKWYIKSSQVAKRVIEFYYKKEKKKILNK
jgi:penicillin-binding protein A